MVGFIKLAIFIITSLPQVIAALKKLYELLSRDKKAAKECIHDICDPEHLKLHADKRLYKGK